LGQNISDNVSSKVSQEQRKLLDAKKRNREALARSNVLRSQANLATNQANRFALEKQAINADIDAARANLESARSRITIITARQNAQQLALAQQTAPIMRLMGALENLTRKPTSLMILQPQSLDDYVHVRAIMASVQPKITKQTESLREQIDLQKNLRQQQNIALESLRKAQKELSSQQESLTRLEAINRNNAGTINADAAAEFEKAIAAGERARDIVENIDNIQENEEVLAALSVISGPKLNIDDYAPNINNSAGSNNKKPAYTLPSKAQIISGFGELSENGYREKGITISLPSAEPIRAPASGTIKHAGIYRNFGHIVIIEHGGGWATLITNMQSLNVFEDQNVRQGSIIGTVKASGDEILIELRRNGRPMDILALVSR